MGVILSCPHCGKQMGAHTLLHSGLGPSTVTCDVTGQPIRTGRKEWSEMGIFRHAWYFLFSIFYAAGIGLWGGMMTMAIVNPDFPPKPHEPGPSLSPGMGRLFLGAFGLGGAIGLGIQFARIRGSLRRTIAGTILTHRGSGRHFSGQVTAILAMLVLGVVIVLLSKWIHSLGG